MQFLVHKDNTCIDPLSRFEYGEPPRALYHTKPKRPKKLDALKQAIDDGQSIQQLYDEHFSTMIQYRQGINDYIQHKRSTRRTQQTKVIWIYGPTGTGKSKIAYDYDNEAYYKDLSDGKWWNSYEQQPTVIFDDLRKDTFKFHELLRLFDRYPLKVQTKGSMTEFNSNTIIVTANQHWKDMYANRQDEDLAQLARRITHTINLHTYEPTMTINTAIELIDNCHNDNDNGMPVKHNEPLPKFKTQHGNLPPPPQATPPGS